MYLMRIGPAGSEKPVVRIDDTHYVDVSDVVPDFNEAFFGGDGIRGLSDVVRERVTAGQLTAFAGERIGAPIARPHQILCIGLNYSDHAAETGAAVPDEPILFTKSPNTLIGPYDDVRIPRGSTKPTGRSSWASSSAGEPATSTRSTMPTPPSPGSPSSTTSASAPSRPNAAGTGPRASPRRPSTRPGPGW